MTTPIAVPAHPGQAAGPPQTENPQLDERLWQAWVERNRQRSKVKLARRVKIVAVLAVLAALAVLAQGLAG